MKTRMIVAAGLLATAAVTGAFAQGAGPRVERERVFASLGSYQRADMQRIEKYLLSSLHYPCDAVVESAIGEVARLKVAQLCCTSEAIAERLEELIDEGGTPAVRYKAMLATMVFRNPEMFASESGKDFTDGEELFRAVASRLGDRLLAVAAY
jgi:hypothetical protein